MKTIEARDLELSYGSQKVLDKVSFVLQTGSITALIGPNGAGKSSAFRVMSGLVKPDAGQAFVNGILTPHFSTLRHHCGYLLESPDFYPYLSGLKNLQLLCNLTASVTKAEELLRLVGLEKEGTKKVQNYSRGMKQRLGFAQVMIDNPDFLILDEPFNGLDPEVKEHMLSFLISLRNQGKGILVSTHLLEDIENIADQFILLNRGKVHLSGNMTDFTGDRQNVILYFSKPLTQVPDCETEITVHENSIHTRADIAETEQLLQNLFKAGLVPYKVSRSSVLHDKYMEIAK